MALRSERLGVGVDIVPWTQTRTVGCFVTATGLLPQALVSLDDGFVRFRAMAHPLDVLVERGVFRVFSLPPGIRVQILRTPRLVFAHELGVQDDALARANSGLDRPGVAATKAFVLLDRVPHLVVAAELPPAAQHRREKGPAAVERVLVSARKAAVPVACRRELDGRRAELPRRAALETSGGPGGAGARAGIGAGRWRRLLPPGLV